MMMVSGRWLRGCDPEISWLIVVPFFGPVEPAGPAPDHTENSGFGAKGVT
ncbi:hypothetical protein MMEU_1012 [Mycobacterium marinum str. Europe]|nr:hypothetical protein MMEU_1012 [Mycobacterium marinum str. Europe]